MHITGGEWKGRTILKSRHTLRPLTARMREMIFATLGNVYGMKVLDLFAGTGSFSLEAISRGAAHATVVEKHRAACKEIHQRFNHAPDRVTIHAMPSEHFIARNTLEFDLIFVDPPYRYRYHQELLQRIAMKNSGPTTIPTTIVMHYERHTHLHLPYLHEYQRKTIGQSVVSFYHLLK